MKIFLEPPPEREIYKAIMEEFVDQVNLARDSSLSEINDRAKRITEKLIKNGQFANAFIGSELRGSFGIRPKFVRPKLNSIIQQISNDTHIFSTPLKLAGNKIGGGWILAMGTNLFSSLKDSPAGTTITEKGQKIPWLRWTLEEGNRIIISTFRVRFQLGKGRSGYAIMVPNAVIGYRVPPAFAGTDHDNWITRDIIPNLEDYSNMILRTLNRYAK
jgi:hypothetical protein